MVETARVLYGDELAALTAGTNIPDDPHLDEPNPPCILLFQQRRCPFTRAGPPDPLGLIHMGHKRSAIQLATPLSARNESCNDCLDLPRVAKGHGAKGHHSRVSL